MTAINQHPTRVYDVAANGDIVMITDPALIWVTIVKHELQLRVGESPFFSDAGIPAEDSIIAQQEPDFHVNNVKRRYEAKFRRFDIVKRSIVPLIYDIALTTRNGDNVTLNFTA